MLAAGMSPNAIEGELRSSGRALKRETITAHRRECLANDAVGHHELQLLGDAVERDEYDSDARFRHDLAVIVQRRAIRALERGAIGVTTAHGLKAQAIIDRRAERRQDHAFLVNLARLLSGAGQLGPRELDDTEQATPTSET
jgi:hypothetical protein